MARYGFCAGSRRDGIILACNGPTFVVFRRTLAAGSEESELQMRITKDGIQRLEKEGTGRPRPVAALQSLSPYKPVSSLDDIWANPAVLPFKLDWNESTVPPSPRVYETIVQFLSNSNHLNWYPELGSGTLKELISDYTSIPRDQIIVTNGSDDALELICKTFLAEGDKVLIPQPTYTHFLVYVHSRGAKKVDFFADNLFDSDVPGLLAAVKAEKFQLVYLVSPNNPSGIVYRTKEVAALLEAAPETLFIVDEAYHEFYGETVSGLLSRYDNLVVTRTFSKCFGIAGLRMGYLMSSPYIVSELGRLFNPKSVNRLGQIAAAACLSDLGHYRRIAASVRMGREKLVEEFRRLGFEAFTTNANFLLVRAPDPKAFCAALSAAGIYVRDRSNLPAMEGMIRITAPTLQQAEQLLPRIREALAPLVEAPEALQ